MLLHMHLCMCVQLQEQLDRFMKMNAELRHKQNVLQTQLKGAVERKTDMEADLKEKNKVIENLQAQLDRTNSNTPVCMLSLGFVYSYTAFKQTKQNILQRI